MKKILSILTLSLVLWSCQKDSLNPTQTEQEKEFVGGAIENEKPAPPTKEFMLRGSRQSITVNNVTGTGDVTAPLCDIITPTPGQTMPNGPATWTITVSASDPGGSGVRRTEMRIYNDNYEYILPNSSPTQTTWTWTPPVFQYNPSAVLLLYVYDNAGNLGARSIGVYMTQNLTSTPLPAGFPTVVNLVCPPILNQGQEQSTIGIATGYYQLSIAKYYRLGSTSWSNSTNVTSPEMLYNAVHFGGSTCGGSRLHDTYSYLMNNGTCFWNTLPYSNTNGCLSSVITNAMVSEGRRNRINYSVNRDFVYVLDRGATKIALNNKRALTFVARMETTAYNSRPGFIWSSSDGTSLGSTALTIVGFDDARQAYKCATTWGTGRCDNGFLWVSYEHMTRIALQAWYVNLV